jgi:hypothetical protein
LVHPHIEISLKPERKAAIGNIEIMGRNAQIGKNGVNLFNTVVIQEIFNVPEIVSNKIKPVVI